MLARIPCCGAIISRSLLALRTLPACSSKRRSFSLINGVSTQSVSYTYFLEPKAIGVFYIQPASIESGGEVLETLPIQIKVAPNPDNIKQEPERNTSRFRFGWDDFDLMPEPVKPAPKTEPAPAKKRKTTRL